jgi:hypothetical protein
MLVTMKSFYTRRRSFYTQKLLHREVFTQRLFTHRSFYTERSLYTEEIFEKSLTHRSFYTEKSLHSGVSTHRQTHLHTETEAFTQRSFYTDELTYTEAFTHRSTQRSLATDQLCDVAKSLLFYPFFCRLTFILCERDASQISKSNFDTRF